MIETPADILSHHASRDASESFVAWRKMLKKPLTERAAILIAKTLMSITASGGDADEALDLAQEHGWQTIKLDWYWRIKRADGPKMKTINGGHSDQHSNNNRHSDPALEQIARLAGISGTSGNGGF